MRNISKSGVDLRPGSEACYTRSIVSRRQLKGASTKSCLIWPVPKSLILVVSFIIHKQQQQCRSFNLDFQGRQLKQLETPGIMFPISSTANARPSTM